MAVRAARGRGGDPAAMKARLLLCALLLAGCASGPRAPDWQLDARAGAQAYTEAYLAGSRAAEADWLRTRQALARTAQPERVLRAELLRCALQVASLDWQPRCEGFEALRAAASAADLAYADYLQGRWPEPTRLAPPQRGVAEQGVRAVTGLDDPLSRLLAAAVLLRSGTLARTEQDAAIALAVETASGQGWRRPLLAWLGLQRDRLQAQGRQAELERVRQRLNLLQSSP